MSIDWFLIFLGMTHPPMWAMWFAIIWAGISFLKAVYKYTRG